MGLEIASVGRRRLTRVGLDSDLEISIGSEYATISTITSSGRGFVQQYPSSKGRSMANGLLANAHCLKVLASRFGCNVEPRCFDEQCLNQSGRVGTVGSAWPGLRRQVPRRVSAASAPKSAAGCGDTSLVN